MTKDFVTQLFRTYTDYDKEENKRAFGEVKRDRLQRKIIGLAVSATSRITNLKPILESGFYQQLKKNLNRNPGHLTVGSKDCELYGLMNFALHPKYVGIIWRDLRKIYKLVFKNRDIITFQTKVDLFRACVDHMLKLDSKTPIGDPKTTSQFGS